MSDVEHNCGRRSCAVCLRAERDQLLEDYGSFALQARAAIQQAKADRDRLRGLLSLWLNLASEDVRSTVAEPNGETLGELTAAALRQED